MIFKNESELVSLLRWMTVTGSAIAPGQTTAPETHVFYDVSPCSADVLSSPELIASGGSFNLASQSAQDFADSRLAAAGSARKGRDVSSSKSAAYNSP
jgi:hypothetical protein